MTNTELSGNWHNFIKHNVFRMGNEKKIKTDFLRGVYEKGNQRQQNL